MNTLLSQVHSLPSLPLPSPALGQPRLPTPRGSSWARCYLRRPGAEPSPTWPSTSPAVTWHEANWVSQDGLPPLLSSHWSGTRQGRACQVFDVHPLRGVRAPSRSSGRCQRPPPTHSSRTSRFGSASVLFPLLSLSLPLAGSCGERGVGSVPLAAAD